MYHPSYLMTRKPKHRQVTVTISISQEPAKLPINTLHFHLQSAPALLLNSVRQNRYAVSRGLNSCSSSSIEGLFSFTLTPFLGNSREQRCLQAGLLVVTPCRAVTLAEAAQSNHQVEEGQPFCTFFLVTSPLRSQGSFQYQNLKQLTYQPTVKNHRRSQQVYGSLFHCLLT